MARLTIYRDDRPYKDVELAAHDLRIGRGAQNDIVLEDSTKAVSRFHAELRYQNGVYVILDLNSQNGTWVNGEAVQRAQLSRGSTVTIGEYRLVLDESTSDELPETRVAAATPDARTLVISPGGAATGSAQVSAAAATPPAPPTGIGAEAAALRSRRTRQAKEGSAAAAPKAGLINWLARQPKPVVFGAFALFLVVMMGLRVMISSDSAPEPATTTTTTEDAPESVAPSAPAPTNEERIAAHLSAGKEKLASGELEAARQEFDTVLLIDPRHAEGEELKTQVEDLIAKAKATAPPSAVNTTVPPPAAPVAETRPAAGATPPEPKPAAKKNEEPAASTPPAPRRAAAPLPPEQGGVTPAPGERAASLKARIAGMQVRYDNGRSALQQQDYRAAVSAFSDIVSEEPQYRDAATLLEQARRGLRDSARQALAAGQKLAADGQLLEALESFERARRIDPRAEGLDDAVRQLRERLKRAGEDAYRRAKQYDALGRVPEAVALYEQAARMLPEGDATRKLAQDRLAALKP